MRFDNTDIKNDLTRIGWKDMIKKAPIGDNSARLLSNISVNKKESFDDQNKTINSLNEQILDLKRKMTFVTEKDKEIQQLKDKNYELKNDSDILNKQTNKNNLDIRKLNNEIDELKKNNNDTNELQKENSLLRRELHQMKNKEIDEIEETINFDVDVKVVEKVKVDINKLKNLLHTKLKTNQDKKVNELLNKYNITNNKEVDKDIISKIIKSLI